MLWSETVYYIYVLFSPEGCTTKEVQPQQQLPQGAVYCTQLIPYEQVLGDSKKEKLPFNRKKPPAKPGLGSSMVIKKKNNLKTHTDKGVVEMALVCRSKSN